MGSLAIVVVVPGSKGLVSLLGVAPVSGVGPFAQGGLDKAFGLAIGLWRVRAGAAVFEADQLASAAKLMGAITAAIVGEQGANADAVASEEVKSIVQKSDGGIGLLIGQDLGESQAGVVVDGDVESFPAGMLVLAAPARQETCWKRVIPLMSRCSRSPGAACS
jgi:hypothetical protein